MNELTKTPGNSGDGEHDYDVLIVGAGPTGMTDDVFGSNCFVLSGDVEGMIAMSDRDIVGEGGNGGLKLKNWVCAFAALGSKSAKIIDYQAVYEWVCGCAFAELELAA